MPDICNDDLFLGIKKLMVFEISGNKNVSLQCHCPIEVTTSGAAANSDFADWFSKQSRVFHHLTMKRFFQFFQDLP